MHLAAGFFAAGGDAVAAADPVFGWGRLVIGAFLWAVALNGGTLALNSYFDADQGDVGYLDRPPAPPRFLWAFGFGLMMAGLGVAWLLHMLFYFYAYAACLILSVVYSVPPWRLKSVAGADVLINMLGYGALTFLAGRLVLEDRPTPVAFPVVLALSGAAALLFAGFYPLTQVYQIKEDAAGGDKTLAVRLGRRGALLWALVFCLLGMGVPAVAAALRWMAATGAAPWGLAGRLAAGGVWGLALAGWLWVLLPWLRRAPDQARDKVGMYRALWVWVATDLALVLAART